MSNTRIFVIAIAGAMAVSMVIAMIAAMDAVLSHFSVLGLVVLGCIIALSLAGTIFSVMWLALILRGKHIEQERTRFETYNIAAGEAGNYPARWNGQTFIQPVPGNFAQPVPHTYSPHITHKNDRTAISEEKASEPIALPAPTIHIPTFAESMAQGVVGPGQRDMLFCHELLADETTGHYTTISPIRGEIGQLHTQFVAGGSQSGKSTYMSGVIAQAVSMGALLYIVDPHKNITEKSLTSKIAGFSDYLIMPPASTHDEIGRLITHAARLRDARLENKATRYGNGPIMVVVDEVPALMAYQHSKDKDIRQLYINLALFMASIGTQTAKVGVTGLYGSQYATKDELGEIEIRDACMSQLLLRLPPTQAQAMRILGKQAVASMPKLAKGHGYLMLSDGGEPLRVASGNVTPQDLTQLARMLPSSPLKPTVSYSVQNVEPRVNRGRTESELSGTESVSNTVNEVRTECEPEWNRGRTEVRTEYEPSLQAKVALVLQKSGESQDECILRVWNVTKGGSEKYKQAKQEYIQVFELIHSMARKAMEE